VRLDGLKELERKLCRLRSWWRISDWPSRSCRTYSEKKSLRAASKRRIVAEAIETFALEKVSKTSAFEPTLSQRSSGLLRPERWCVSWRLVGRVRLRATGDRAAREGWHVNRKNVHCLYRELGLTVRTKRRRKHAAHGARRQRLRSAPRSAGRWTSSTTAWATVARCAADVIDSFGRECLTLHVDRALRR